jgi:hypothetical protein
VSRKDIVVLVVAVIISVMVGSTIFEVFDVHDTKPFPIDPEFFATHAKQSVDAVRRSSDQNRADVHFLLVDFGAAISRAFGAATRHVPKARCT